MKLGELDIKKAYFGTKELTPNNAYIGTIPIIKDEGIPNNEIWYTSSDGNIVTPYDISVLPEIDTNTYNDGKGIIKFKTDVTSIGKNAFCNDGSLNNLTSVTIPNSVTSIGDSAFIACSYLTSINIPNNVTSIGNNCFQFCNNLTSINIPNSVIGIKAFAFGEISAKISFSKLYSTYTNKIFIDSTAANNTYNVEFNISEIPINYNISLMLPQGLNQSGKGTITYNIYTDYAPCKDQALALVTQKTIVNVYHIDGTPW